MLCEHCRPSPLVQGLGEAPSGFLIVSDDLREPTLEVETRLRMLRMTLSKEKSRKIERIEGSQASTTLREDSIIGK